MVFCKHLLNDGEMEGFIEIGVVDPHFKTFLHFENIYPVC